MPTLDPGQLAFCALAIVIGFGVRGAAGFGAAAVATPLAALVAPAQLVIPVIALLQLLSNSEYCVRNWRSVAWSELRRLAPVMTIGVATGLYLFATIDPKTISKGLGVCVIGYAAYVLATSARRSERTAYRISRPIAGALNWTGGLIGALFGGASTPFYAIYLDTVGLSRDTFRATMTTIVLAQVVLRIAGYAGVGVFSLTSLALAACAVPLMALGAFFGERLVERVPERTFTAIVGIALLASGTALTLK
ncbi:MAG: sulfite exporter TauE/SafE family protein [Burkholderiales bacterium]|nr:sulfite exporter TauE/SafE family protein [Burkholderiales bacterium]